MSRSLKLAAARRGGSLISAYCIADGKGEPDKNGHGRTLFARPHNLLLFPFETLAVPLHLANYDTGPTRGIKS